jgi:hypothetical protein
MNMKNTNACLDMSMGGDGWRCSSIGNKKIVKIFIFVPSF